MLFGPHHSLEYVFVFHRKGLEQREGEQMGTEFSFFRDLFKTHKIQYYIVKCVIKNIILGKKYCVLSIVGKENKG